MQRETTYVDRRSNDCISQVNQKLSGKNNAAGRNSEKIAMAAPSVEGTGYQNSQVNNRGHVDGFLILNTGPLFVVQKIFWEVLYLVKVTAISE